MMTKTLLPRPTLTDDVLARLRAVVGDDNLVTEPVAVDEFKDPYYIPGDDTFTASAVIEPVTTEQVQEIMRIANEFEIPVWPHSQGKNYGYGGASPVVRGSLQISFKKMNKVIEINEELAYAVVEPGVRWFDLYDAIEAGGYSLQVSVPDLGWGSVIGNSLDNGITYMPYGADFQALNGLEVVLADGSLLRTGMGAIPDSKVWHLYKRGLGPVLDPLFSQSNYGIVVRAGVWLKRKPAAYTALFMSLKTDADLVAGVDAIRELRLEGILEGVPSIYTTLTAAPQLVDSDVMGPSLLTEEQIQEIADSTGVGRWAARAALWGSQKIVEYKLERVKEVWEAIPGATVTSSPIYSPDDYKNLTNSAEQVQAGIPTLQLIEATPVNMGHIGFSPIVPLLGSEVRFVIDQMRARVEEAGLNFLGGVLTINERSCCIVAGIPFDVTNKEEAERAFAVVRKLVVEIGALGYGEYRAHIDYMDAAQDQYSFNDNAYRKFAEMIKNAVDPKGIIMPGRHGIWPASHYATAPESATPTP
jgi:4-cresol dehydrogenase (hydroxylating)